LIFSLYQLAFTQAYESQNQDIKDQQKAMKEITGKEIEVQAQMLANTKARYNEMQRDFVAFSEQGDIIPFYTSSKIPDSLAQAYEAASKL